MHPKYRHAEQEVTHRAAADTGDNSEPREAYDVPKRSHPLGALRPPMMTPTKETGMVGRAKAILNWELSRTLYQARPPEKRGLLGWLRGGRTPAPKVQAESIEATHYRLIEEWKRSAQTADDALTRATCAALARVASAIYGRRGRILGSKETIEIVCLTLLGNGYGSEMIGGLIDPYLAEAVAREGPTRTPL